MARHVYVHIPFCEAKCKYCSFFSVAQTSQVGAYFDAVRKEVENLTLVSDVNADGVDTVYFGGGTPSSVDAHYVCDLLGAILKKFDINPNTSEITIEVNPHSLTPAKARAYREAGFNRVSMGVQSLHDKTLKTLGRLHSASEAGAAILNLKEAEFINISCDLMLGIPGQTLEELMDDARLLVASGIRHISMYSLSIEEGTPFEALYPHLEDVVPEELERQMYHGLRDYLRSQGINPYEISNCAQKGAESIHNNSYWEGCEYYGIGAGAHGYLEGRRFGHPDSIKRYIENPLAVEVEETLNDEDKVREYCMLQLRTSDGISRTAVKGRFGICLDDLYKDVIISNINAGLLEDDGEAVRLTSKGLDLANLVFEDFL